MPKVGMSIQYRNQSGNTVPAIVYRVDTATQVDLVYLRVGSDAASWATGNNVPQSPGLTMNQSWDFIPA